MLIQAFNPSTQETEAGGSRPAWYTKQVPGHIKKPCFEKGRKEGRKEEKEGKKIIVVA